jgi:hypothetical protein
MMENNYGKLQECSTEKRREGKKGIEPEARLPSPS